MLTGAYETRTGWGRNVFAGNALFRERTLTTVFVPALTTLSDVETWVRTAADVVERVIRDRHESGGAVLGLPTGNTPVPLYRELARRHREGGLDVSRVRTFNLDEFVGLPENSPHRFRRFMDRHLFDAWKEGEGGLREANIHFPSGSNPDAYERAIVDAGGIDLLLLGIGTNGHLAFNEPGSAPSTRTREVPLHDETRVAQVATFGNFEDVPLRAVTMGLATILEARKVLLLASGASKADVVARALTQPIAKNLPASYLRLHPDASVLLHLPPERA